MYLNLSESESSDFGEDLPSPLVSVAFFDLLERFPSVRDEPCVAGFKSAKECKH